jgi:hypothetical protein
MKTYPSALKDRNDQELKLRIKSSLPKLKALLSLTYVLFEINKRKGEIRYCEERTEGDKDIIEIPTDLLTEINIFFSEEMRNYGVESLKASINGNPLFGIQMEPLKVALEIFGKISKIDFVDGDPSSQERTLGNRYAKRLMFTTNLDILSNALTDINGNIFPDAKKLLFKWILLNNPVADSITENEVVFNKISSLLTIFSEETKFLIRKEDSEELIFQQEGIYEKLLSGNTVFESDSHESVGPFRILKSFVSNDLHKFIAQDAANGFSIKDNVEDPILKEYALRVSNYLDLLPKKVTIYHQDVIPTRETGDNDQALNVIYFGPPGTGKSHKIAEYTNDLNSIRVTFHPDTDYAAFVGSYKPAKKDSSSDEITYKYVPQSFLQAYLKAWTSEERIFLIIEEINRGSCAQIFGDIFQLIERNEAGYSKYKIDIDSEIESFLCDYFMKKETKENAQRYLEFFDGKFNKMSLPDNLYIHATMNTSDQSLFPIDSAFKRRWDWEYVPIKLDGTEADTYEITIGDAKYNWISFIEKINEKIEDVTQSEDKKLGHFFIKSYNKIIGKETFKTKVMFYLWNDILKDFPKTNDEYFFMSKSSGADSTVNEFRFNDLFAGDEIGLLKGFMEYLDLNPIVQETETS